MKSQTVSFIRGLAIIGVVMVHSPQAFDGIDNGIKSLLSFGQLGCQAFFLLSAYCLCAAYDNQDYSILKFYKRRFLSLAPAYWSTILINLFIVALSSLILGHKILPMNTNPLFVGMNFSLIHGVLPILQPMNCVVMGGWFVGTMMIFYILFPLLHWLSKQRWWKWNFLLPFVITALCWTIMVISGLDQENYLPLGSAKYYHFINQLPAFIAGFFLYEMKKSKNVRFSQQKFIFLTALTVAIFYSKLKIAHIICPTLIAWSTVYLFIFLDGLIGTNQDNGKFITFISKLGDSSFGIYLSHFWIMFCIVELIRDYIGFDLISDNVTIAYFVLLPSLLVATYYLSIAYNKWISFLKSRIAR